tara:strand:- start:143 stop:688 length:546 start_codon:yes stop_codon:yes gene_type:complete
MKDSKQSIVEFWFEETAPQQWFQVNPEFDQTITDRFLDTYHLAAQGHCDDWKMDPQGSLALCILLDQFPRNMFRGQPKAFATDKMALLISKHAIHRGFDQILKPVKRRFLFMPFMHSEQLGDQKKSVDLFASMQVDDPMGYEHALRHYREIERFGRFPYRNKALGRENTSEENEYLKKLAA